MDLNEFDYHLPSELIAQYAVQPKSFARLMVLRGDEIQHRRFFHLIDYLQAGDVLVMNRSRVLRNKLTGQKVTGAAAEAILMNPLDGHTVRARIKCSKVRVGNAFIFEGLHARVVGQENDIFHLYFEQPVAEIVDRHLYPNPPYIHRTVGEEYQTVYALEPGSLAAPTAGLHFTRNLIRRLKQKGVLFAELTLHVGFGTFLPIRDQQILKHTMEPEYYTIDSANAERIREARRLFVVGTTTFKALQSSARPGGRVEARSEHSDLFIYPGVDLPVPVTGLITNFHLPKSTLILLVSAYYGKERILKAYRKAVECRYRFFSLGDAMLLLS
ncbi:tRNA preQ1(34) S-adenosylmethionine ribosyltransferase-isomerase QueA [candidate division KSB1 bacterium]|nr:tRNA preQ1(34) S-adenosylmethionine ribosyltransferase-isomerase QueA [candidate division KSB1 bacterium]